MQENIKILINDSRYTGDRTNDDKDRAFMSNFTIPTNLMVISSVSTTGAIILYANKFSKWSLRTFLSGVNRSES
jgi:hypothetical protein